jgi:hypothetical protein
VSGELGRPAEPHTGGFGALTAFAGAGADKLALELGKAAEHALSIVALEGWWIGARCRCGAAVGGFFVRQCPAFGQALGFERS